ncbi:MAG: CCA tRNA nucleotidyltransferase [Dehalococcoidia bacterium]
MRTEIETKINIEALPLLRAIRALLGERSLQAYLVGGYVRDSILSHPTRDIDVAVRGPVEELGRRLADSLGGSLVILGKEDRVARVVLPQEDGAGTPWQVDLVSITSDIAENLGQRDFTIDALAVDLDDVDPEGYVGEVIDPFGGLKDLQDRLIRAVGLEVFRKDPARLMRAIRLAAKLDFSIYPDTQSLMGRDAQLLAQVAPERIRTDLCSILATDHGYQALRLMEGLGLLQVLVPELEEGRGVGQPKEHHWDVYDHCLETVQALEQLLSDKADEKDEFIASLTWARDYSDHFGDEHPGASPRRTLVKLASLLHDVGKPSTKTVESSGRIRFYGHSQVGADMAGRIMRRLRFSTRETKHVQTIVLHHLRPGLMSTPGELPTAKAIYRYFRDTGEAAIDTVFVNLADYRAARGPMLGWEEWHRYAECCRHILSTGLAREEHTPPKPLVNGHDLMRELQLPPGPLIGTLLDEVREARTAGEIETREEALELAERSLGLRKANPAERAP